MLYLYSNQLTGPIPSSFGDLSELDFLDMNFNQLTESIPSSLGRLSQLQMLYLYSNELSGSVPASLGNLTQLQYLDLSFNRLSGSLPVTMKQYTNLLELRLQFNELSGPIFPQVSLMNALHELSIQANSFSGNISCSSLPSSLITLNAQGNNLGGMIGDCFCDNLPALQYLHLGSNWMTRFSNCSISSLRSLDLSNNRLDVFPFHRISQFSNLTSLDLSKNRLYGDFPQDVFQQTSSLRTVSLAYNNFSGDFPIQPCVSLSSLEAIDLSGNSISGMNGYWSFPPGDKCNSPYASLATLKLSDTGLNPVASYDGNFGVQYASFLSFLPLFPALVNLDLSSNHLTTGLDSILSNLPLLKSLNIQSNPNMRLTTAATPVSRALFQFSANFGYPFSVNMTCYSATFASGLSIQADPLFYDYRYCVCRPGFFGKPPHCLPCLPHAACSFTSESIIPLLNTTSAWNDSGNVVAQEGYYASPFVPLGEMMSNQLYPKTIEICAHAGTDLTPCDANQEKSCKTGYQGRLCSGCSSGYFRTGDRCVECPDSVGLVFFAMFVVLAAVGLVVWSFFVGSSSSGLVKVLVFFWQALFFIRAPMSSGLYSFTHSASSVSTLSVAGPECFFHNWDYATNYGFAVTAPFVSLFVAFLIWILGSLRVQTRAIQTKEAWLDRCRRSAIFLFLFFFMSAVSAVLASLSCATDAGDGKSYLVYYPDEECSPTLQAVSSILLLLFAAAIPGTLSFLVWRSGVLSENAKPQTRRMLVYSLLFGSYRPNRRWWELVVTVRRVLVVSAYVTIPPLSEYRTMLVATVLVTAASIQAIATPYHRSAENSLEIISLGILLVNLVCSVQSQVLGVQDVNGSGAIVFLLNIGFSAVLIAMLVSHFRRRWRKNENLSCPDSLNEGLLGQDAAL
eukprot:ANDGO_04723.mRNA.1 Putative leucine-rich repeat-containing protein DDB_G0281931